MCFWRSAAENANLLSSNEPSIDDQGDGDANSNTTEESSQSADHVRLDAAVTKRLYTSHFLSTWNSRVFEFGSTLYLASIYPNTLTPMSVYALVRGISVIIFASSVGAYVDHGDRLQVVRVSIIAQRIAVVVSCILLWILGFNKELTTAPEIGILVCLAACACVEKLAAVMNLVSVERDWVVVIGEGKAENLRTLNAQMRRIDLVCKLVGPFAISLIDGFSTEIAIWTNLAMSVVSIVIEYSAIAKVYKLVPQLRQPKQPAAPGNPETASLASEQDQPGPERCGVWRKLEMRLAGYFKDVKLYFLHHTFLASFAQAPLYFTVLSFGGQMVTYLLSTEYTSFIVGATRTIAVVFEITATWLAPVLMAKLGTIRGGLWSINWQIICLAAGVTVFWTSSNPLVSASGLVVGTILSRVGLRAFDLCVQTIVQEEIEPENRGTFSAMESACQSAFELCSYAATIIFSRPDSFQWPVLASCVATVSAGVLYTGFVRVRRGHLVHYPQCIEIKERRQMESDEEDDRRPLIAGDDLRHRIESNEVEA